MSKRKRAIFDTPSIHIEVQSTMMAYIRGLFSWLFNGCEVTERLGRHRASLAKPYLVMAVQKSVLDCLRLQFLRILLSDQSVSEIRKRRISFDILRRARR